MAVKAKNRNRPKLVGKNNGTGQSNGNGNGKPVAYRHPSADSPMRPEVGTHSQFKKPKPSKSYRYDSSLSPALEWDVNPVREQAENLIANVLNAKTIEEAKIAGLSLKAISKSFLNWSGKAERLSLEVGTLPLFIHERLSTKAIMETIQDRKRDKQVESDLFADPQHPITDQILKAYEHRDRWVNRMILGDSVVIMNSLVEYESLAGKVQMIYMDPPYGVSFGSNFQPFVRERDVKHGDDAQMTREPEMVRAYRDTWELGVHSYLSYLQDRFLLCKRLLSESGSLFVQISDENVDYVRGVLTEIFGRENFVTTIVFQKTSSEDSDGVANTADYLLWFAKDRERMKAFPLYRPKRPGDVGAKQYVCVESPNRSEIRKMTPDELADPSAIPVGWRICRKGYPITSQNYSETRTVPFQFEGKSYHPGANRHWSVSPSTGLPSLGKKGRLYSTGKSLNAIMYLDDMPGTELGNVWTDTGTGSFTEDQIYVVQTSSKVIERCLLMTTEPGDLVLDPTCGSGTTAYASEKWGRRWIVIDTSRVPLALSRQRLLSATYRYYQLKDSALGPAAGFRYKKQQDTNNRKADRYGIAVHNTLSSIAGDDPPNEIVFREFPEIDYDLVRVTGPFVVEATIPTATDGRLRGPGHDVNHQGKDFSERMLEVLRCSPILRIDSTHQIKLKDIRRPTKSLALSGEAIAINGVEKTVAFVFGPENASISEGLICQAAKEAEQKGYSQLIAIGFAIEPNARLLMSNCEAIGIPAMYVQATPDLVMGDLLKTMRTSQIFSVCGLPDFRLKKVKPREKGQPVLYQAIIDGLDTFDPTSMEVSKLEGADVPAWFLDTDYNNLVFHVDQAFFPRTGAWENLKKSLKGVYNDDVWAHLAGNTSALFEAGINGQIAVKVIDDRGNELLAVKSLKEASE